MNDHERDELVDAGDAPVESEGRSRDGRPIVDGFVNQIFDVIFGLSESRSSSSEGGDWLAFDAAIRGLHGAIVALEGVGTARRQDGQPTAMIHVRPDRLPGRGLLGASSSPAGDDRVG